MSNKKIKQKQQLANRNVAVLKSSFKFQQLVSFYCLSLLLLIENFLISMKTEFQIKEMICSFLNNESRI